MEQHAFNKKLPGLANVVCSKCGLISLNNTFSQFCIQAGCDYEEHPKYNDQRKIAMNGGKK